MNLTIHAPGHPHQGKLKEFYSSKISGFMRKYPFLHHCIVNVKKVEQGYEVGLEMRQTAGAPFFAKATHEIEHQALKESIEKCRRQLEKHKIKTYKSFQRGNIAS